ncbi:hypothetical protein FACS1894199_17160 [Bacteroidia bacterium]|nr:hypothetical protein FACS1894199_17160 [Bacteroidia bacterium]
MSMMLQPTTYNLQENVVYEGGNFEQLCEVKFLKDLFGALSSIVKNFDDYIFFIMSDSSGKPLPSSMYYETKKKKILVLISDECGEIPYHLSPYFYAIFKAYLQFDKFCVNNIFNFALGCVKDVQELPIIPIKDRKYSIFFSGNLNSERMQLYLLLFFKYYSNYMLKSFRFLIRRRILKIILLRLKSNFDNRYSDSYINFTKGFRNGISPAEYSKILSDSKIVLCPKGFTSSECFRHYEAMRAGCVIISEKLPNTYFYKESPIIQVNNWQEGLKVAAELQKNTTELEKISNLTQDWYKKRCSEEGIAQYMVKCLKKIAI